MTPKHWGLFRISFAVYMLAFVGLPELTYLSELPDDFFHPHQFSLGQFAPGFPGYLFLKVLGLIIVFLFLCILFGYRTRTASIVSVVLVIFAKTFVYSLGQINHDFIVWLVPVAGAFANWGAAYSIDSSNKQSFGKEESQSWPIVFLVVTFCFAMALSGYQKFLGGWADLYANPVQQNLARMFIVVQRQDFLAPALNTFDNFFLWKALDYLTLIFEIGILIGIFFPKIFRLFLMVAVVFHLSNLLILNIDFSFNFAFYALFLPWPRICNWIDRSKDIHFLMARFLTLKCFVLVSFLYLIFFAATESSLVIFSFNLLGIEYLGNAMVRSLLGFGIVIWIAVDHLKQRKGAFLPTTF
ncbi:MAG: hypothetical protein O3C43_02355 [Verrucomicrobia bacterium]|nr:hypothetical protein [Verrucomicrobiota bacterium]MDA1065326.1 hypothetical protein [Verrucomicrobiota bacterium]